MMTERSTVLSPASTVYLMILGSAVMANIIFLPAFSSGLPVSADGSELTFFLLGVFALLFTNLAAVMLTVLPFGPVSLALDLTEYLSRRKAARDPVS